MESLHPMQGRHMMPRASAWRGSRYVKSWQSVAHAYRYVTGGQNAYGSVPDCSFPDVSDTLTTQLSCWSPDSVLAHSTAVADISVSGGPACASSALMAVKFR